MTGQAVPVPAGGHAGVQARGVRRTFGSVVAVDHADVDVPAGAVTALVGPNGSGKTTLLLVLAGLLRPDAGTVTVAGADPVRHPAAVHARVGWMPDVLGTWESLTCREVLGTFAAAYRVPDAQARDRIDWLLAELHLRELADAPARVLSRGQKQRLGLARALVHDPQVLLLDEPASGLDPRSRVDLRVLLRRLAAQGKAVLVSSHVLSELDELADRAVFVSRGRTVDEAAVQAATGAWRRWEVRSLDVDLLRAALASRGVREVADPASAPGRDVHVLLPSDQAAADLLRDLVADGVPVVSFAPAAGQLEQVYLGLEEERR
ncbi:ABC transporter ATP-binding protein [Thalassiella azotivora]